MRTLRAMRRLQPDPVPDDLVRQILHAGTCAPGGQNAQRRAFLVVTDPASKRFFGERYHCWTRERFGDRLKDVNDPKPTGWRLKAALHLAAKMHEAPVLLLCCGGAIGRSMSLLNKARGSRHLLTLRSIPACRTFC